MFHDDDEDFELPILRMPRPGFPVDDDEIDLMEIQDEAAEIVRRFHAFQATQVRGVNRRRGRDGRAGRPWTHTALRVVCLAVSVVPMGDLKAPPPALLTQLRTLGLGVPLDSNTSGKSTFPNGETPAVFQRRLCQLFPRLVEGSFQVFVSSKGCRLHPLPGWETETAEAIKRRVKQARLFVVPDVLQDQPLGAILPQAGAEDLAAPAPLEARAPPPPAAARAPSPPAAARAPPPPTAARAPPPPAAARVPPPPAEARAPSPPAAARAPPPPAAARAPPPPAAARVPPPPAEARAPPPPAAARAPPPPAEARAPRPPPRQNTPSPPRHLRPRGSLGPLQTEVDSGTPTVTLHQRVVENLSLEALIEGLVPRPPDNAKILVTINRNSFLEDTCRCFFKEGVDLRRPTDVKFEGSPGIDNGGLSRQFRMELMNKISRSRVFQGPTHERILRKDAFCMRKDLYRMYGALLAYVVAHGGPFPSFFAKNLFDEVVGRPVQYTPEDIIEPDKRAQVMALLNAPDADTFDRAAEEANQLLDIAGCDDVSFTTRESAVNDLAHFLCKDRMQRPLDHFKDGLSELGLLRKMQQSSETCERMFLHTLQPELCNEDLLGLWSAEINPATARGQLEVRTHAFFLDFIQELDAGQCQQLLLFATGQTTLPPGGFDIHPTIIFKHPVEYQTNFHNEADLLPSANTCALQLSLPVPDTYQDFKAGWLLALQSASLFDSA